MDERELLEHYRPWLRVMATRMSRADEVDDVASEGWVALWKALPSYDGRAQFDAWCKAVMRNGMLRYFQHWSYAKRDVRRVDYFADVTQVCDLPAELDGIELAYHHGQVRAAIDGLTPQQRAYVLARFWGGLTYTELNARFETNSTGIWKWARRKLAAELAHLAGVTG